MRKILLLAFVALLFVLGIATLAGLAAHGAMSLNDMKVTVDGETLDGPTLAAIVGGAAFFGVLIACIVALVVVASVALVVPLVLIAVAGALVSALFVGLAPIAIPVLLVVGAYVLLSRPSKRGSGRALAPPSTPEQPIPHA